MPSTHAEILHIVLPVPVRHHFDYLCRDGMSSRTLQPGMRVMVPFGRSKQMIGMITGRAVTSDLDIRRLKPVTKALDLQPLFDAKHMKLLQWASDYYHYPLGELIFSTLPAMLKAGKPAVSTETEIWKINPTINPEQRILPERSTRQRKILTLLEANENGLTTEQVEGLLEFGWREPMKVLLGKGLVTRTVGQPCLPDSGPLEQLVLNIEQRAALDTIRTGLDQNRRILLDGVTGSGKTEVYLEAIREVIIRGKQAMILVPEIGLTPQLVARFRHRIHARMVILHSGLSDGERLAAWIQARDGTASIILGTRSAIWTPLHNPGLYIIDEEHDPSYKQQESFRYSARDIAILRANNANVPVVLGSATPSLESLYNVELEKMERLTLSLRAENAVLPRFRIVDIRGQRPAGALSEPLLAEIGKVLDERKQILLYLNRRGYAPVLMCEQCSWIGKCRRCDIPYTVHKQRHALICHHCGSQQDPPGTCPDCGDTGLTHIGHGTERLTEVLNSRFPGARILRVDRDSTRRKGSMEQYLESIRAGETDILVGTQMLAKGHHLPGITLVGIIDADRGLYSADFRASERMAQNIIQVSGRAGRAGDPGLVMIQTRFPEHPFLNALIRRDYHSFTRMLLEERQATGLPPFSSLALLRAEALEPGSPLQFLNAARASMPDLRGSSVEVFGPFPAPVEKRAGKYRFQLLLQSGSRTSLQKTLRSWIRQLDDLKEGRKIRWSLDVDPQEML